MDGKIYIGNDSGKIAIFKPGKTKKLLGHVQT